MELQKEKKAEFVSAQLICIGLEATSRSEIGWDCR